MHCKTENYDADLGLELRTRASAEAVVLWYRAVPDQVSPEHHEEDNDDDEEVLVDDDWDDKPDHGGDLHDLPEEDGEVKSAKRGRVEENVTWAECVL